MEWRNGTDGRQRNSRCEYEALEACLKANGRDSSKCQKELEEFRRSCRCEMQQERGSDAAQRAKRQGETEEVG